MTKFFSFTVFPVSPDLSVNHEVTENKGHLCYEQLASTSANQELKKSHNRACRVSSTEMRKEMVIRVNLALLTVKSLKTRFREPLRRAMRAALG